MAERTTVDAPARRPARVRNTLETMARQRWLYLLLAPSIVAVFVFSYLPIYGLTLAFRDFNAALGPFASPWSKPIFYNFWFFQDPEFWYVLRNTVRISVLKFVFGWPAPILLALLLNEIRHSGFKRTVQTISYLPHFLSWVIMAAVIYRVLDYQSNSPVNVIIGIFGAEPMALMGDEQAFIPIVVLSAIFKEIGWGTIIYLATIANINPELYEQAEIDGAGKLRQTRHITLPGMVPIISILLVLSIPAILQAGFDQLYNLMNASTRRLAYVTDIYVLRLGLIQGQYSTATALELVYSVVGLALVLIANYLSKSRAGHGIW
jgi:putative aldouronate transport system permease protein